jgi:hypothetical protein
MILDSKLTLQPLEFFNVYPTFTSEKIIECPKSFVDMAELFRKV